MELEIWLKKWATIKFIFSSTHFLFLSSQNKFSHINLYAKKWKKKYYNFNLIFCSSFFLFHALINFYLFINLAKLNWVIAPIIN